MTDHSHLDRSESPRSRGLATAIPQRSGGWLALALAFASLISADLGTAQRPDTLAPTIIIANARIYTLNSAQPWAEALAVKGERIVAVGSSAAILKMKQRTTTVIDARGKLLLPGFVDSHIHFMSGALSLDRVTLEGARDVAGIQQRLKRYATTHPGTAWIEGRGWNYGMFGAVALPHKRDLDALFPARPVFLEGYDGHTSWANSAALRLAGITRDTPDPPNGVIVRDPATHEATGALKESASRLVRRVVPPPSRATKRAALLAGMRWANAHGITRVHSAGGDVPEFPLFDELERERRLTVRFYMGMTISPPTLQPSAIDSIEALKTRYHSDWLSGGAAKLMIDGVIESHTAAMMGPYSDDTTRSGTPFWERGAFEQAVAELDRRGFQLFIHAIGDAGVGMTLDALEQAALANKTTGRRPRVEHIETISERDIPRFGPLGVIASMQPLHSYPDFNTTSVWARNVGPERVQRSWVWNRIAAGGGRLTFGSDWPVVTLDPWLAIQTGVTRQTEQGMPPDGFIPSERLSVARAIDGYTLGAAYAGRRERDEGSVVVGKLADLILVSQDLFTIQPSAIAETKVLLTMVGGKVVYRDTSRP